MSSFINNIKLNNLTHKLNLLQSDITALEAGTIPPIHGDLDMNNNNVKDVNNLIFTDGTASHSLTFDASKFTIDNNEIITTANIASNIPPPVFVTTATSQLNMVGNAIVQADYVDFVNQDTFNDGTTGTELRLQNRIVNNKPVITIQTGDGVQGLGVIYDTVYNPLPTSGGGGGWVGTATSVLNMVNNPITDTWYLGFTPMADLTLPQLTISNISDGTKKGFGYSDLGGANPAIFYDTVYNKPPTSGGGGWVGIATSDLNMATNSIKGVGGINTTTITLPYNEIYSVNTALAVTRDGEATFGYIYDSHYNPPPTTAGPTGPAGKDGTNGTNGTNGKDGTLLWDGSATSGLDMQKNDVVNVKVLNFSNNNEMTVFNGGLYWNSLSIPTVGTHTDSLDSNLAFTSAQILDVFSPDNANGFSYSNVVAGSCVFSDANFDFNGNMNITDLTSVGYNFKSTSSVSNGYRFGTDAVQLADTQSIAIGFINSTYQFQFYISNTANVYSFHVVYNLTTVSSTFTTTSIGKLYLGYDNNIFSCWHDGVEILDLNSVNFNNPKLDYSGQVWQQYILGSKGLVLDIPLLYPFSKYGTLVGSVASPNTPTSNMTLIFNTGINVMSSAGFPLTSITNNNFKVNLLCVDKNNNNVLTIDNPLFSWLESDITYNATTNKINLAYNSNPEHPNPSDLIYTSAFNTNTSGPYTYQLYLSMMNDSVFTASMTAAMTTFDQVPNTVVCVENMPLYLPQSDSVSITQSYTTANFTVPSSSFIQFFSLGFPNANSYWKFSMNTFVINGLIAAMAAGSTFTITLRLSETNNGFPTGLYNSYGINFTVAEDHPAWTYTLQGNEIDLWYYSKTPTKNVVLSAFLSTSSATGTCNIQNLTTSGLLTSSPWVDSASVITQLSS